MNFKAGKYYKWNNGVKDRIFLCLKILNEEKVLIQTQEGTVTYLLTKCWQEEIKSEF